MRTIIINILLFIVLLPCQLTAKIEILTPPEHSSTTSDQIMLVGRTSAPMLEVIIDNRVTQEVVPFDGFFHARLIFGYGLHEILIKPIMSGDSVNAEDIVEIDVLSSPQIPKKFKKMFIDYNFHYSDVREYCIECHGYNEVNNDEEITSSEICFECHTQYMDSFQSHIPDDSSA